MTCFLSEKEITALSPLHLAYIGDSVFDLLVRIHAVQSGKKLKFVHLEATSMVRASAQAAHLTYLMPFLTEEEQDMVRKGRNAHPRHTAPKSASSQEYSLSTAFETLIGYLYLHQRNKRIHELFQLILANESEE